MTRHLLLRSLNFAVFTALFAACVQPADPDLAPTCASGVKVACQKAGRICGFSGCKITPESPNLLCEIALGGEECTGDNECSQDGKSCGPKKCEPACTGRKCGDDGCGGTCGPGCGTGETCTEQGQCEAACVGSCTGKACGDDGCGKSCGTCGTGLTCATTEESNKCVPDAWTCDPDDYADTFVCNCDCGAVDPDCAAPTDMSLPPVPLNGCAEEQVCDGTGACVDRVPATWTCAKARYDDGLLCDCECGDVDPDCTKTMGVTAKVAPACLSGQCDMTGHCAPCTPDCAGKSCGSDGCGGVCLPTGAEPTTGPTAPSGGGCLANGQCVDGVCTDPCAGTRKLACETHNCGPDNCGGSCGTCSNGDSCLSGVCGKPNTPPADNSCKNRCGGVAPSGCACDAHCGDANRNNCCADKATACCVPQCTNKTCGSDGCGGECGVCGPDTFCSLGTSQCAPTAPTGIYYPTNPATYYVGIAISKNKPVVGGGAVDTFSVTPTLPAGLSIATGDGSITGTPASVSGAANYTVTATNVTGFTTKTISIEVKPPRPLSLSYSQNPIIYDQNVAIMPNNPAWTGGMPTGYTVTPALPTGLVLDLVTGVITGTPTVIVASQNYTVTASNGSGSTSTAVNIGVRIQPPAGLAYPTIVSPVVYTVNQAIGTHNPTNMGGALASYSVTPALPTGLNLNTGNGQISGTPTVITAPANYTITGTNTSGMTSVTLNIEIRVAPPTGLAYSVNPASYTVGIGIGANGPTNTGGPIATYAAPSGLPAGLSIATGSGIITGTPTTQSNAQNYLITGTNAAGTTSVNLNIEVFPAAPTGLQYTQNPVTYTEGVAIGPNAPTSTGGPIAVYSAPSGLPAGLSIATGNGTITGTPTTAAPQQSYPITGTNISGSTQTTLLITVNPPAPAGLTYMTISSPVVYTVNQSIGVHLPSTSGGPVASYSVTPSLPTGLNFNNSTGQIDGTPTVVTPPTNYTVTASNITGMSTRVLNIEIRVAAPTALSYATSVASYTVGIPIGPNAPTNTGGPIAVYAAPSGLPAGLSIATGSGIISGTPAVESNAQNYLITGTNAAGSTSTNVNIEVFPAAPTGLQYAQNPVTYTEGVAIGPNAPTSSGGPIATYSAPFGLPAGLSIASGSGIITGTPSAPSGQTSYVITGTNVTSSTNATLFITVNPAAPTGLVYSVPNATYTVGTPILPDNTPSVTGINVTYSIMPDITAETGLSFSTTTGIISGTPTLDTAGMSNLYVVTASNVSGSTMASIFVQVNAGPWNHKAYIKAASNGIFYGFGTSVALKGDLLAVGEPFDDSCDLGVTNGTGAPTPGGCSGNGIVYVYQRTGTTWAQAAYFKPNDMQGMSDAFNFGVSVSISGVSGSTGLSGTTIAVGAPTRDNGTSDNGAVYVFLRGATNWSQQQLIVGPVANSEFGHSVSVDNQTLVVGAWKEGQGAVRVYTRTGSLWSPQGGPIVGPNTAVGLFGQSDRFGWSVDVSGDTLVAGADGEDGDSPTLNGVTGPTDSTTAQDSGAAYVYTRSGSTWSYQSYLKPGNIVTPLMFFGSAVAVDGNTIVVGAPGEQSAFFGVQNGPTGPTNVDASGAGAGYVFTRSGNAWTQEAFLKGANTESNDAFGTSVALKGNAIVIGAISEQSSSTGIVESPIGGAGWPNNDLFSAGAAYLFERSGIAWANTAYLKASNADSSDQYGMCVAVDGNTIAVGANGESENGTTITNGPTGATGNLSSNSGAAYVVGR